MTEARMFKGLTYAEYERLPGWRWGQIRLLHDGSPRHVKHAVDTGSSGDRDDDTPSRAWLRAVHALVFEPQNFRRDFSVFDGRRTGKLYDAHLLCNPGASILNPREHRSAVATAEAIKTNPAVAPLLAAGDGEVSITWTDRATGLPCKGRLDWLGPLGVVDLKTLGTTNERQVASIVASRLYHGQLGHYAEGLRALGIDVPGFYLVAAEGKGAQDVAAYRLGDSPPDGALHRGRELRADLMRALAECVEADRWPGRHESVESLELPAWATDPDDDLVVGDADDDANELEV